MKHSITKKETNRASGRSSLFQKEGKSYFFSNNKSKPFFNANPIQTKLTIGQPNDIYEKEADSMADKVVQRLASNNTIETNSIQRTPISFVPTNITQAKCATCENEEKLQKKEEEDFKETNERLQKKPIFESNAEPPDDENNIQRKCAECDIEDRLQKKSKPASPQTASPNIESSLSSSKGSGSPLPQNIRGQMESSFRTDFSGVRIHDDSTAVQMSKDLNAQAFTHGSDVYFNSGKLDTNSNSGKHLLAHELTHVVQQGGVYHEIQRQPGPPIVTGAALPATRTITVDANVFDQINRGNQAAANTLNQLRASGVILEVAPYQKGELVNKPDIPRTATANRLMLQETSIGLGTSPTLANRVDVNLAGQTITGSNILSPGEQQLIASARAGNAEVWTFDRAIRNDPSNIQNTFGVRVAPECQIPLVVGPKDYRVGRQLLGLQPVEISLTGEVTTNTTPSGGGGIPPTGGMPTDTGSGPAPSSTGSTYSTGTRIVAGGLGIIVVINEILGGINRVRNVQQNNIDMGNARISFWERFGANPVRGLWDQNGRYRLPDGTTPSTSIFGSPSYPYVVDIDVNSFRSNFPRMIDNYQDFLYFLDAAKTLGTIEEDPLMPNYPTLAEKSASRDYYAWVNMEDQKNRKVYYISDIINQVRNTALNELDDKMRDQMGALLPQEQGNIFRLKNGAETPIYRSAGGGQQIVSGQQILGANPWVRTIGKEKDVGGWFSTDIRTLVVPANADAQRAALISSYWVKQSIEDTFDEVQEGGRQIIDRQPADGRINSFVAGPEPGGNSRFGQTRYYRHPDPDIIWTVAIGELNDFWVEKSQLEKVPLTEVDSYTHRI